MTGITTDLSSEYETCQRYTYARRRQLTFFSSVFRSEWLEELADVECDWDSISPPSTPIHHNSTLTVSGKGTAETAHDLTASLVPEVRPASSFSTGDYGLLHEADMSALLDATAAPSSPTEGPTLPQVPKRIIRTTFPTPLKPNSPIQGLTSTPYLRTLFCLGSALNIGCQAARTNTPILIELFCRVLSSHRTDKVQHFVLADLTHDNPPFVDAVFESWKGVSIWDDDARVFLEGEEKKRARGMGSMKRRGTKWVLELVSIWEVSSEEVGYVAGICT